MNEHTFVIVGAGLAGAGAAGELRERGFDGRLVLVGAERELPYERPPLSKDYLRGEAERSKLLVHAERFYEDREIELMLGVSASKLDPGAARLTLSDGREISYTAVLLATGSEPRRLAVPGADLDGIYYLRTLADCEALRTRLGQGGRVAVVGAGWIGSEVAASARQLGLDVTMLDPLDLPNVRVFGREIGEFYRQLHAEHGVRLMLGESVAAFEGQTAVRRLRTGSGRIVDCDLVVVGVGVRPRVALAQDAGLDVDGGVVVDARLRSSAAGVFAAGDVANAWHPFFEQRIRLEHWSAALNQGPAAARSMLGDEAPYEQLPYFFSDQYETGMEYSGLARPDDRVVFRGSPADGEFVAFWLRKGRVVAGMNVNVWDVNEQVQELIRTRSCVDVAELSDPDTPLDVCATATARRPAR